MCTIRDYQKGCRCAECKAANAAYQREYQAQRKAMGKARPKRRKAAAPEALPSAWFLSRMKPQHPHSHRWKMASPNGPTIRGKCDCGRVRFDPASPGDGNAFNPSRIPARTRRGAA